MCSRSSKVFVLLLFLFSLSSLQAENQLLIYESELVQLEETLKTLKATVSLLRQQLQDSQNQIINLLEQQKNSINSLNELSLYWKTYEKEMQKTLQKQKVETDIWKGASIVAIILGVLAGIGGLLFW